jgi:hypothetical protein
MMHTPGCVVAGAIFAVTDLCSSGSACLRVQSATLHNNTAVGGAGGALMVTDGSQVVCTGKDKQAHPLQHCLNSSSPVGRRLQAVSELHANTSTPGNSRAGVNMSEVIADDDEQPPAAPSPKPSPAATLSGNSVTAGYGGQIATGAIRLALFRGEWCREDATPQNVTSLPGLVTPGTVVSHAAYGEWLRVQLFDALGQCVWGSYDDSFLQLQVRFASTACMSQGCAATAGASNLQYWGAPHTM